MKKFFSIIALIGILTLAIGSGIASAAGIDSNDVVYASNSNSGDGSSGGDSSSGGGDEDKK